ncbi:MAG: ATP-dependent DNA helicase RecG [Oscillospiraceae bacterium]
MSLNLSDSLTVLKGIGEKKAGLYRKLGLSTVGQLIRHLPRDYLDLTRTAELDRCEPGMPQLIRATVTAKSAEQRIRRGLSIWKVQAVSDGFPLLLIFYNLKYTVEALRLDEDYLFYGPVSGSLLRREMSGPSVIPLSEAGSLMALYPATAGLSSRMIGLDIRRALALLPPIADTLPPSLRTQFDLLSLDAALRLIHRPADRGQFEQARRRIAFEELLVFSAAMRLLRGARERHTVAAMQPMPFGPFWAALPFSPTAAQRRAVEQAAADLCSGRVMNRLLQGDVGSGKTLVAAAAAYLARQNGFQTALMAPTELLAEQHARTLSRALAPLGLRIALITGSLRAKARREAAAAAASGEADVVVGTHALLSSDTTFFRLGLVVTDEQHRFGVAQRAALSAKGDAVHTLVMSATPIPRTLSLILYGDLDVSVLDELPPGRTPVATYRIDGARRARAFHFIRDRLDEGRQAYIVCPLVEEEEQSPEGLISASDYAPKLAEGAFAGYRVGLLHGRMKPADKASVMARFVSGELQLLVATTVVEVGVDVPNAVVMLVENAERFGLSQLHQLRGRVGRGADPSTCILISDSRSPLTAQRLRVLCQTNDGFAIAEEDLRLRGPGDLLGVRQHGLPGLANADLIEDAALLEQAGEAAAALLGRDPTLTDPACAGIAASVRTLIAQIGERPN